MFCIRNSCVLWGASGVKHYLSLCVLRAALAPERENRHERRAIVSLICDFFVFPSAPSAQDAHPSGFSGNDKQTADSKQKHSHFKQQSPPLMKRCIRSPSCHPPLVRPFIKMSAAGTVETWHTEACFGFGLDWSAVSAAVYTTWASRQPVNL